ncbi:MAG TPA: alpha/beta hydrolase, partial [Sphingopyxis sp.]|nr:alpha/beta hydrolase [Sphingopyxis sp.]
MELVSGMAITRRSLLRGSAVAAALPVSAVGATAAMAPIERLPIWPGPPPGGAGLRVRDEVIKRSPDGPADDIAWPHVATPMLNVVPAARLNGG